MKSSIQTKFGIPMQTALPINIVRSKLKMEVEFQYGGRLFRKPEIVLYQPWTMILQKIVFKYRYRSLN